MLLSFPNFAPQFVKSSNSRPYDATAATCLKTANFDHREKGDGRTYGRPYSDAVASKKTALSPLS